MAEMENLTQEEQRWHRNHQALSDTDSHVIMALLARLSAARESLKLYKETPPSIDSAPGIQFPKVKL